MLETLIQQSPMSGTGLEIALRHEATLGSGSESWNFWLATRKADGVKLWVKAAAPGAKPEQLEQELRLLQRTSCSGIARLEMDGTEADVPYLAFKYGGETEFSAECAAAMSPTEALSFCLSLFAIAHDLETARPAIALQSLSSSPLLVSPVLMQPLVLGLGDVQQTASEEAHRTARTVLWEIAEGVLGQNSGRLEIGPLTEVSRTWVKSGRQAFDDLRLAFTTAAFEVATNDL